MSAPEHPDFLSFAARIRQLAAERPDQPVITTIGGSGDASAGDGAESVLTYAEFDEVTDRYAHHLLDLEVGLGDFVTVAEPNSPEFLIATAACWKIGAIPQPVSARLPGMELAQIVELANSKVVVGAEVEGRHSTPIGFRPPPGERAPLASRLGMPADEVRSPAWKAPTSGGSTGTPKLIVAGDDSTLSEKMLSMAAIVGAEAGKVMVMPGPLYHNGPLIWAVQTLLAGGHLVLLRRFDAETTLAAIDRHQAYSIYLVPTMMQRMWKLPDDIKFGYDLSSLKIAFHLAEPCAPWLKEVWLDWIGPEHLFELYGGTEGQMFTVIDGNTWRERPGSVGQPASGEVKIFDADGVEAAPGEEGEVWMRWTGRDTPTYTYIGAEPERRDGWECLGDMGWIDADGFLYLGDRRKDMILVGGANIYPAEIEAAICAHPDVLSAAVIGLEDEERGNRIHAIVQPSPAVSIDEEALTAFLRERLINYKLPRSYEWSNEPLRDEAGKVRRSSLREARS